MPTHVFTVQNLGQAQRDIEAKQAELRRAIGRAQLDAANATLRVVVRDSPVDTGLYKGSWEVKERTALARLGGAQKIVELRNDAPHAGIIELGARPFWPPLQPLVEWAKRKGGIFGFGLDKHGRFKGKAKLKTDEVSALEGIARAIQAKIARVGIKPRYVMKNRLPFAEKALRRAFDEYVKAVAGKPPAV